MIKFYSHDKQRPLSVIPNVDVTNELILAKMYKNGVYVGLLNSVQPELAKATVNATASGYDLPTHGMVVPITVKVEGKKKYETDWTELASKQHTITSSDGAKLLETEFDPKDFHEFRAVLTNQNSSGWLTIDSVSVQSGYNDVVGSVVGAGSGVEIAVPCDARAFEPGEDYSVVFVAEDTGVIGKKQAIVFGEDGYST